MRFQIEFNFRDAKQYWGLDDFMNIKEQQLLPQIPEDISIQSIANQVAVLGWVNTPEEVVYYRTFSSKASPQQCGPTKPEIPPRSLGRLH
ncbi:MAG: hypothetical protein D3911_15555 [Candidatus Electrothrix sp. AW3_4]|nr:hypothetical protein [Candidatus Electrothrix gigas]